MKLTEQSLIRDIIWAFKKANKDAASILVDYILAEIYGNTKSPYYQRLKKRGGLVSAFYHPITTISGNTITLQVYDSSYIKSVKSDDINKFNHHMSVGERNIGDKGPIAYKGEPISELIVEWYDRGTLGSPYYDVPEYNYFENAFKEYGGLSSFIMDRATDYVIQRMGKYT